MHPNIRADLSCVGFFCSGIGAGDFDTPIQSNTAGMKVNAMSVQIGPAQTFKNVGDTMAISAKTRMNTTVEAIMMTMAEVIRDDGADCACFE